MSTTAEGWFMITYPDTGERMVSGWRRADSVSDLPHWLAVGDRVDVNRVGPDERHLSMPEARQTRTVDGVVVRRPSGVAGRGCG